jgi:polyhydroxybutyrate depolymerase
MLLALQGRIFGLLLIAASGMCSLACSIDASDVGTGTSGASGAATSGGSTSSAGTLGAPPSGGAGASSGGTGSVLGTPGGSATGGTSLGGSTSNGGSSASAGANAGGSATTAPTPSAGCGKTTTLMNGRASIDVGGKMREYILAVPTGYDSKRPYRLVFGWHPLGGSASQVANGGYYGLKSKADQLILVAPEGLPYNNGSSLGWGNTNGGDIAFLQAMLDRFRTELCVDEARIFSTGFSFGGMMSNAAGCSPTSMMRAIAPMAGNSMVSGCLAGDRSVAMMGFHGDHDGVVNISGGRTARDVFVKRNGCSNETTPVAGGWCEGLAANYKPCSCVSYNGCKAGYPVIWCEYNADHMPAPSSGTTLWDFFSQF